MRYIKYFIFMLQLGLIIVNPVLAQDDSPSGSVPITFTSTVEPMTGVAPLTVTLTAETTAEDVEGITYHWQASSGKDTYQSGAFAKMTFELPGEYNISFVAEKNDKILAQASHTVTVQANQLPITRLTAVTPCELDETQNCETPLTVELSAAESTDSANGKIVGYRFTSSREGQIFPNEKTGPGLLLCPNEAYSFCPTGDVSIEENWSTTATPIPAVELKTSGTHNLTVIVIDDKGGISNHPASVTVSAEKSTKPSAFFNFTLNGESAPMTITLDASDSDDNFAFNDEPNGPPEVVKYQWKIISSQNDDIIYHESVEPTWQKTLQKAGDYKLSLTVEDNDGQTDTATQNVYVKGTQQPVAVASVNPSSGKIGTHGLVVTLNAEGSYAPDGFDLAQYRWRISDGQTVEGPTGKITLKETGLVTIELEVIDKDGYTGKDFETVMVLENTENNLPPTAVATFSKLSGRAPLTVEGNGTGSYDPDGDRITHHWSSTAGHDFTGETATFVFDSEGKHIITLEVTDDVEGNPLSDEITQVIDVQPPLPAPTISAIPETGINPLTVVLSTAFYEGVKYQWQTDGGQLSMANSHVAMIKFEESGTYTITLTVTDTETDKTQEVSKTITVEEAFVEPLEARAEVLPAEGFAPLTVTLNGSDSEGDLTDYEWNISKVGTLYGRRTSVLFEEAGEYIITLTVTDKSGRQSTAAIKVIVKPKPSPVETKEPGIRPSFLKAVGNASPRQICPGGKITLNGKGSQGDIQEYKWKVETADSVVIAVLYKKLSHLILDEPGVYLITLTVFDEAGDSDNDAMVVMVDNEHCNDIPPTFPIISPLNHTFLGTSSPNNQIIKPNDPNFGELWALDNSSQPGADIGATKAWGITTGVTTGEPIVCAVIDSGVDGNHPDLKDNMIPGWNFIDNNADTSDNCGHGTQVAGIIAAAGNNGIGIAGVNWFAKIMPLVVAEYKPKPNSYLPECLASDEAILAALKYAKKQGVKCINMSLGAASSYNPKVFDAIKANNQALIIAAAGNGFGEDNDLIPYYPASYELDNILSVCATDRKDQLVPISNVGKKSVDLCAPGSGIISTYPEKKYTENAGTSLSTAYVSGAASLLWSAFPHLSAIEIKKYLIDSADYVRQLQRKERRSDGSSKVVLSVGRLNVYQALLSVQSEQQTFSISNTGEGDLQIGEIGLSGSHASAFQILSDNCSKKQFAPSQTCTVEVQLASSEAGEKQAVLEVPSNASQTATAQLSAVVKDDSNDKQLVSIDLPTLNRAEPSVFHFENNELELPSLAIPNEKGQVDVFQLKFCPVGAEGGLRFALCDYALVDRQYPILGDSTIDMTTGIIKIPGVEAGTDSGLFYVVELRAVLNAQGDLEFELLKAIQVH